MKKNNYNLELLSTIVTILSKSNIDIAKVSKQLNDYDKNQVVDDLIALSKIKKADITNLLKAITTEPKNVAITKEYVVALFNEKDNASINTGYKKDKLNEMYFVMYGENQTGLKTKLDIIVAIRDKINNPKKIIDTKTKSKKTPTSKVTKTATKIQDYTKEFIFNLYQTQQDDYISKAYKKADLDKMYCVIYESKPLSKSKKPDIINSIRNYIYKVERANSFQM